MATEPDINIGAIAEQLNGKVDTDVGNTNATGNAAIASYAMLGTHYDDLALGASGTTYTAPADGWYTLTKLSSAAGQLSNFVAFDENNQLIYSIYETSMGSSQAVSLLTPASKGMKIRIDYTLAGSTMVFRFIYAKGSEPQS